MRNLVFAVTTVVCFFVLPSVAPAAQNITVRDNARIVRLADPHFAPDGKTIALVETHADLESNEFRSEIVLVDVGTHQSRPLTRARHHANSPRWSPSGDMLGFLAPDSNKVGQLWVTSMNGGDALQITSGKDPISQFAWSPDGRQIAYALADAKPELKDEAKYVTAFPVGNDDVTTTEAVRPTHLWLISAQGGVAKRLTSGKWSLPSSLPPGPPSSPIQWTQDGKSIVLVRQETPSTGDQFKASIQILDLATGRLRALTGETLLEGYPKLSPDGSQVAYWRNRDAKPSQYQDVWLAPLAGGAGRDISVKLDENVYGTWWAADGSSLVAGGNIGTTVGLWRLKLDGTYQRIDLSGVTPTNGYWVDADVGAHGEIAFVGQTGTDPYELYLIAASGGSPQAVTEKNADLSNLTLGRTETVSWKGPAGRTLDGVLTYPPDFHAGQRYPLVLYVHGGPNSSSRERFNVMPQALAAHGWLVFEPNYRGSDNSGNAFYASIYKDAGQGPGADVMSGVEFLKGRGLVDPTKMAVTGWSYGGYMTTWLTSHYDVWKAAVAGAPVTDWVEMYNLSDGNVTNVAQTGASPYLGNGMELNRRQSPATYATKIKAPMLIMCDTGDFRVPIAQSFGLYRALKDNQVTTEFWAIPTGGHFPSDPIGQMDVYSRWIEWLTRYL
jgi:dipeptidyl aminopeptidase/acylaminoacyl peptidase